jgi:YbbR domain-containing protein
MLARLLNNWPIKLLALAIAIVLRVYVGNVTNPQETKQLTVPIIVTGVPDNLIATDYTQNVTITFTGNPEIIDSLGPSDIAANVNLSRAHSGANPGLQIVISEPPDLRDQIQIENKKPTGAAVYLDTKGSINLGVRAEFTRFAPVGYEYELPTVTPTTARVDGPESLLKSINKLVVFADTDSDVMASPTTIDDMGDIVPVDGGNHQVEGVTVTPAQAHFVIPIRKIGALKSLVISPQVIGALHYPLRISQVDVDPTTIVVSGPAPLLAQTSVALTMPIDVTAQTGTFRQTVRLDLPAGLTAVTSPNVDVTVHITDARPTGPQSPGFTSRDTGFGAIQ